MGGREEGRKEGRVVGVGSEGRRAKKEERVGRKAERKKASLITTASKYTIY